MNALLFYCTLGIYFVATVLYLAYLLKPRDIIGRSAHWLISIGFFVHCGFTVNRYLEAGHTPITNLHESLSFSAWPLSAFSSSLNANTASSFSAPSLSPWRSSCWRYPRPFRAPSHR